MSFPYQFKAPNGVTYTVTERLVQTGVLTFSRKPVYDLTSSVTGVRTYSEKDLANALSLRLDLPLAKTTRAVQRMKSDNFEHFNKYNKYNK